MLKVLCREPGESWSPSTRLWSKATRSALTMISEGRVRPALIEAQGLRDRFATWVVDVNDACVQSSIRELADELSELPRCTSERRGGVLSPDSIDPVATVQRFLDCVAGQFIPSPGLKFLYGSAPFTGLGAVEDTDAAAAIQRWIDIFDDGNDSTDDGLIVVLVLQRHSCSGEWVAAASVMGESGLVLSASSESGPGPDMVGPVVTGEDEGDEQAADLG
ncbi:hypothetical protein [Nocardia seriolae]|uniref:hypothetical protein n=1 Tax=Nocardia seriolae TaxID=37332 RepID=UPI00131A1AD5|nr:hypothetical protein [Nocardia seriolae]